MTTRSHIPFNQPYMTGKELEYIAEAHRNRMLSGDGPFTERCHEWLVNQTGSHKALLTHSCTAALELAALVLNIEPGDEVILPSYTFVSTANAFVLRGATPVFVDVREDTLNLDERLIEEAITEKTRAIVPVHYAGVSCEMDAILGIARQHDLAVVEDAAQGVMSSYKGQALGGLGDMGAFSFHETKNLISGEGGALLIADPNQALQAEIVREKGTDRSQFFRGQVDKYSWQSVGSSFLPGELISAFLWAQLEAADEITRQRMLVWNRYDQLIEPLVQRGFLNRPHIPDDCEHNAHMYYVLLDQGTPRDEVLARLRSEDIHCVFHYVPLHSSNAGLSVGRQAGSLAVTERIWKQVVRLPLWIGISQEEQERVVESLARTIEACG